MREISEHNEAAVNLEFFCYGPHRVKLPPLERMVYAVLADARGVYRSSGMRPADIWAELCRRAHEAAKFRKDRRERVEIALTKLAEAELIREVKKSKWTVKR